ncbi:MAG: hypothetical protein AAGA96_04710 [Verrucomicrobiota bacterium]
MENEKVIKEDSEEKRSIINAVIVGGLGLFSAIYLFNPTAGFLEFIPDNIPVIGNLDEAAAAALLISCLAYFGVDLGNLFGRRSKTTDSEGTTESTVEGVIDVEVEDKT